MKSIEEQQNKTFKLLWESRAPTKVTSLAWRLFLDRLPTKLALQRRGINFQQQDILGRICNVEPESSQHLFFSCSVTYGIWQVVYKWLNIEVVLHYDAKSHFNMHLGLLSRKKGRKLWSIIWLATIWSIWLASNDANFNLVQVNIEKIIDAVKVRAWLWIRGSIGKTIMSFYEWETNPWDSFSSYRCYKDSVASF